LLRDTTFLSGISLGDTNDMKVVVHRPPTAPPSTTLLSYVTVHLYVEVDQNLDLVILDQDLDLRMRVSGFI
jgi:hypothetical protein